MSSGDSWCRSTRETTEQGGWSSAYCRKSGLHRRHPWSYCKAGKCKLKNTKVGQRSCIGRSETGDAHQHRPTNAAERGRTAVGSWWSNISNSQQRLANSSHGDVRLRCTSSIRAISPGVSQKCSSMPPLVSMPPALCGVTVLSKDLLHTLTQSSRSLRVCHRMFLDFRALPQ